MTPGTSLKFGLMLWWQMTHRCKQCTAANCAWVIDCGELDKGFAKWLRHRKWQYWHRDRQYYHFWFRSLSQSPGDISFELAVVENATFAILWWYMSHFRRHNYFGLCGHIAISGCSSMSHLFVDTFFELVMAANIAFTDKITIILTLGSNRLDESATWA